MKIGVYDTQYYDYYASSEIDNIEKYNSFYNEKIQKNYQKAVSSDTPKFRKQPTKSSKKMSLKNAVDYKKQVVPQREDTKQTQSNDETVEPDL